MTTEQPRKPWQRRVVHSARPDVVVVEGQPLGQITIYEDMAIYTRRTGSSWRQYPISIPGLAQTLARVPTLSGLLPPNTLGTGRVNGTPFYVLYIPAHRTTMQMENQTFTIPLPPLIWSGCGTNYRIWALDTAAYPDSTRLPLMVAPFPNCYRNGGICWGSSDPRPVASPQTLPQVLKLFLQESYFNLHVADGKSVAFPVSVVARWQQLVESAADSYPLDDLMPAETQLGWLLEGRIWAGAQ